MGKIDGSMAAMSAILGGGLARTIYAIPPKKNPLEPRGPNTNKNTTQINLILCHVAFCAMSVNDPGPKRGVAEG